MGDRQFEVMGLGLELLGSGEGQVVLLFLRAVPLSESYRNSPIQFKAPLWSRAPLA